MRSLTVTAPVTAVVLAMTVAGVAAASAAPAGLHVTSATGVAQRHEPGAKAVTYNEELVPTGAKLTVFALSGAQGSTVVFGVSGLVANRQYGAHVHVKPCGAAPADAGPHFQDKKDPVQPSVDPAYANPQNEVWLDLTTNAAGNGVAFAHVKWGFGDRQAESVVVHETHTHTDPGHAGTAGARLACLNADF